MLPCLICIFFSTEIIGHEESPSLDQYVNFHVVKSFDASFQLASYFLRI